MLADRLHVGDGLRAKFLDLRSHGFYEIEVEHCVDDSALPLPLLALAEGDASAHGPHDGRSRKLQLGVDIQVLGGIEVLDKVGVGKVQDNLVHGVGEHNIIVSVDGLADLESVSLLLVPLNHGHEWDAEWGEGRGIHLVAHLLQLLQVEVVESPRHQDQLVNEKGHQDQHDGYDVLFHRLNRLLNLQLIKPHLSNIQ